MPADYRCGAVAPLADGKISNGGWTVRLVTLQRRECGVRAGWGALDSFTVPRLARLRPRTDLEDLLLPKIVTPTFPMADTPIAICWWIDIGLSGGWMVMYGASPGGQVVVMHRASPVGYGTPPRQALRLSAVTAARGLQPVPSTR